MAVIARRPRADTGVDPIDSPSLTDIVYRQLRESLMRGRLKPHQRLKVRELAASLGVSETPVREAIFQLARERAIEIKPRYFIRVRRLSLAEYLEQRRHPRVRQVVRCTAAASWNRHQHHTRPVRA